MKLLNTTTNQIVEITITDARTGVDYTADFMQISHNPDVNINTETEQYEIEQDAYEYWSDMAKQYQELDNISNAIRNNGTREQVEKLEEIEEMYIDVDFDKRARYILKAINEQIAPNF